MKIKSLLIIMTWRKRSDTMNPLTHNSTKCASNSIVYTSKHYINIEFGELLVTNFITKCGMECDDRCSVCLYM